MAQDLAVQLMELYTEQVEHMGKVRFRPILEIITLLGMTKKTFYRRLHEDPEFKAAYDLAKVARVDIAVDEIINIADETTTESENIGIASARLRIDARKWIAEKHSPNYSNKVTVTTNEHATNMTQEEIEAKIAMLRKKTALSDQNPLN